MGFVNAPDGSTGFLISVNGDMATVNWIDNLTGNPSVIARTLLTTTPCTGSDGILDPVIR